MKNRFLIVVTTIVFGVLTALCLAAPKHFDIPAQAMTGSNTLEFTGNMRPFYLTSVTLTYPGGGAGGTTLQINHIDVSAGITTTNILAKITSTNTFTTIQAYFLSHKYITRGDSLVATSTDASAAVLKYDAETSEN